MNFDLTEEQEMLRKMAKDFLANECPKKLVREMEVDEKGHPPELWRKMAELGWTGLPFPEKFGGGGGSFLDLSVLLEEMGRACLPGPFFSTVVLGGLTILDLGSEEQKKSLLPQIAQGKLLLTLALTEPSGSYGASSIECRARADGDNFVLEGTKLFVTDAGVADYIICVARTADSARPEEGLSLFLVDAHSPGLSCLPLETMAGDKQYEVAFKGVRVPRGNLLGELNKGWAGVKRILSRSAAAKSVEMVGGAQQVLEMTVQYAKDRVQFGRPIGSFQAIQHYCANMAIDVDGCRFVAYKAAWALSEGMPATMEVSAAKAWVGEAYRRLTALSHQIHGAIGFTKDHDLYLYYARAKTGETIFGDGDFHREMVAQGLGL
ncbi:MAG: acyl-CoA dehydrogenase family protein [Dehalococcoidia bacterium]|nr:acyl-CoA dehydrogenase family protein [Dehalococcoidia bacterium]